MVLLPIVAIVVGQFWLRRNLVTGDCPVCGQGLNGLAPLQTTCPNCGTALKTTRQGFERAVPAGTVEVQAVAVDVAVDNSEGAGQTAQETGTVTLEVEARALPPSDPEAEI